MKRALLPVVAAVLVLSACGSDGGDTSGSGSGSEASNSATSTDTPTSDTETQAATPSGPSSNEQARTACQEAVVGEAAGATFSDPGTLRVASSPEGKQYTVSGTAVVSGAEKSYECAVLVTADKAEVSEVTVG